MTSTPSETAFEKELQTLINRHSKENESDTPDFILANYLKDCLLEKRKARVNKVTSVQVNYYILGKVLSKLFLLRMPRRTD